MYRSVEPLFSLNDVEIVVESIDGRPDIVRFVGPTSIGGLNASLDEVIADFEDALTPWDEVDEAEFVLSRVRRSGNA